MIAWQDAPRILVLGLGLSGLAMARWCVRQGARVTVADTRPAPPGLPALQQDCPGAEFVSGPLDRGLLQAAGFAAACRSPGLSPAQLGDMLDWARAHALPVYGELDLFVAALAQLKVARGYDPQVLAVTGSNGKTTVTALTGQLLARAGRSVAVAGNIGATLLDSLQERLDADALPDDWVLELSSFQLAAVRAFDPAVATVLNIAEDHLDWHGSMDAYVAAKARVFGPHTVAVLNRDDPRVLAMRTGAAPAAGQDLSFGADLPQRAGDLGLESVGGVSWLVRATPDIQRLMPAGALRIQGRHNALNALAALALAAQGSGAVDALLPGLRAYRGERSRTESIAIIDAVEYFDDSKGTNVAATVAALDGLGQDRKLLVLMGGDGKGQDFAPLAEPVRRHARAVVLYGRDAPKIEQVLRDTAVPLRHAGSLQEAVLLAAREAQPGDAVLLSPACASFDMFPSYRHRAVAFREAVAELARARGSEPEVAA